MTDADREPDAVFSTYWEMARSLAALDRQIADATPREAARILSEMQNQHQKVWNSVLSQAARRAGVTYINQGSNRAVD